jgi:hypothetical protein
MSGVFLKKTKNEKIIFSENRQIMSEEPPLDKRMKFNPNCLDPDPICFLNGTQPLIVTATDAAGNVITVCDLVNNEPACEKADFSDTPAISPASEYLVLSMFDINARAVRVFQPTGWGMSAEYKKFQHVNRETLTQTQKQRYDTAMLNPPPKRAFPVNVKDLPLPFHDCTVAEIMSAFPGKSSNNPVTLDDSDDSEEDSSV